MKKFVLAFVSLILSSVLAADVDLVAHLVPFSFINVEEVLSSEENSKSEKTVFQILNNVLDELDANIARKFVWPEVHYFKIWYYQLSKDKRSRVYRVLRDGQFEIINGFSAQLDEGLLHTDAVFHDVIDGMNFLESTFGVSINHYFGGLSLSGHSNSTIKLLQRLNFKSVVISNLHYLVKNQFKSNQHLEFNWGSEDDNIVTHVLSDEQFILEDYDFESKNVRQVTNPKKRADKVVKVCRERSAFYRTNHILIPFGGYFKFIEAQKQFANLEKILSYITNKVANIEIKFSTFSEYFADIEKTLVLTNTILPTYSGDFFPNSRDQDKYYIRRLISNNYLIEDIKGLNSVLDTTEAFYILAKSNIMAKLPDDKIERVVSMKDNKDIVSSVDESNDNKMWFQFLYHSINKAKRYAALLNDQTLLSSSVKESTVKNVEPKIEEVTEELKEILVECIENLMSKKVSSHLILKPELSLKTFDFKDFYTIQHPMVFYNEAFFDRIELVTLNIPLLPLNRLKELQLFDKNGNEVDCQVYKSFAEDGKTVRVSLAFLAKVPSLGFTTYFLTGVSPRGKLFLDSKQYTQLVSSTIYNIKNGELIASSPNLRSQKELEIAALNSGEVAKDWADDEGVTYSKTNEKVLFVENDNVRVEISTSTGMILSIEDKFSNRITKLHQLFYQFEPKTDNIEILDPASAKSRVFFGNDIQVRETKGSLLHEVEVISELFYQKVSVALLGSHLSSVSIVLKPKFQEKNKDYMMRFATNMGTTGVFFTANSENDMIERRSYENVPIASNFYPCYGRVALKDEFKRGQLLSLSFPRILPVSSLIEEEGATYSANLDVLLHTTQSFQSRGKHDRTSFEFTLSLGSVIANQIYHQLRTPLKPFFALETKQLKNFMDLSKWRENFKLEQSFATQVSYTGAHLKIKDQFEEEVFISVRNYNSLEMQLEFENIFQKSLRVKSLVKYPYDYKNSDPFLLEPREIRVFAIQLTLKSSNEAPQKKNDALLSLQEKEKLFEKNARIEEEYARAISEDKEILKVLEKRIKRTKTNLVELKNELDYIPKTSFQAYEETEAQIKVTEKSLEELTDKLVMRMQHMKETQQKLDVLTFRMQAIDIQNGANLVFSNPQMREWEATLHGIVTGAGGMLVVVLLYNLLCVRLDRLPRVPIKWVGFNENQEELPLRKAN